MSNFSNVYRAYLDGYAQASNWGPDTEREAQALALGVHHRTAGKPPLMRSTDVTAELRAAGAKVEIR